MQVMTLDQSLRWIDDVANPGKYGWRPENSKTATYINKITRKRFARHQTPSGKPWKKTAPRKRKPRKGTVAAISIDMRPGSKMFRKYYVRATISAAERRLVYDRWREKGYFKTYKALFRRGKKKVTKLRDKMTRKSAPGHVQQVRAKSLTIGTRSRGAAKLQYGTSKIPSREFYGLNPVDINHIDNIFADGFLKRSMKGVY